jgi:hypothetical protein
MLVYLKAIGTKYKKVRQVRSIVTGKSRDGSWWTQLIGVDGKETITRPEEIVFVAVPEEAPWL